MIFIDGHVHLHETYEYDEFFTNAFVNFSAARGGYPDSGNALFVLLLAEGSGENGFLRLKEAAELEGAIAVQGGMVTLNVAEDNSAVFASHSAHKSPMLIIPGHQIVTSFSIEILGLFMEQSVADGMSLKDTISQVRKKDGLVLIPWGVGKWLGSRGRIVVELVRASRGEQLLLGDNGNRPWFWPGKDLTELASENKLNILSGSDPLRFGSGMKRIGGFGTIINVTPSMKDPVTQIRKELTVYSSRIIQYGRPQRALPFFYSQIGLRLA